MLLVAVMCNSAVVSHVPCKMSAACALLLRRKGTMDLFRVKV